MQAFLSLLYIHSWRSSYKGRRIWISFTCLTTSTGVWLFQTISEFQTVYIQWLSTWFHHWLLACFLYFFFWPLCCLFFFEIRILITPLVSSNPSSAHRPIRRISMLIIVERTIRQCAELPVMTVMILNVFNCLMCEVVVRSVDIYGIVDDNC